VSRTTPRAVLSAHPSEVLRTPLAFLVAVAIVAPQLYVYSTGAHPLAIANESVAYRYFYSLRVWMALPEGGYLPQGQLLDALGYLIQSVLGAWIDPAEHLRTSTQIFSCGVFAANLGVIAAAIRISLPSSLLAAPTDRGASWLPASLVAAVLLVGYYASRSGLNVLLAPDYYLFEASSTALCLALGLRLLQSERPPLAELGLGVCLGALGAILLTLKISLVGALSFPLAAALPLYPPRSWLRLALVGGLVGLVTALAIVLTSLGWSLDALAPYAKNWLAFLKAPGAESGFFTSLFHPFSAEANAGAAYGYAWGVLALLVFSVALTLSRVRVFRVQPLASTWRVALPLLVAGAHIVSLVHRPAGTTLWEASLFATATAAWLVRLSAESGGSPFAARSPLAFLAACAACVSLSLSLHAARIFNVNAFRESSAAVWEVHRRTLEAPAGTIVVVPDNMHTAGTVGEALMKGAANFPTWTITSGAPMLARVAPGIEIRQTAGQVEPAKAITWVDVGGEPTLAEQMPELRARMQAVECTSFGIQNWEWWHRTITICPPLLPPS